MPNWCSTTYKIVGKKEEVHALCNVLTTIKNTPRPYNRTRMWLVDVVEYLGGDWETIACRGEIIDFNLSEEVLTIYQETAWNEQEDFRHFLESQYPHTKTYWREEECGCELYYHNDHTGHYFPEQYLLDSYEDPEYFLTLSEAIERVKEITGRKQISTEDDMMHALDLYLEEHEEEDIFYSMHKFEFCED